MGYGNDDLCLETCRTGENMKSVLRGESRSSRKTAIILGLSNREGDHRKLEENVFNLLISSGEILTNFTPD
jgi:hypothetical protein